MKLVADEGMDAPVVHELRRRGHDVWYVAEEAPGLTDDEVLQAARTRVALLLTADKDFGELVFRQQLLTTGVVLVRVPGLTASRKAKIVAQALVDHGPDLPRSFTVIESATVRVRSIR